MRRLVAFTAVAAPTGIPLLLWLVAKFAPQVFGVAPGAFLGLAGVLALFAVPVLFWLALRTDTPGFFFPLVGALVPLPATFLLIVAFGAIATDEEMAQRVPLLWLTANCGAAAGLLVQMAHRRWRNAI